MPRISKGPRLYKRKAKRRNGRLISNAVWTIRDGDREVATGVFASEAERKPPRAAEDALVRYITSKYRPPRRVRDIEDIDVADVLAIYHAHREAIYVERGSPQSEVTEFADRVGRLNDFFGGKMLAEVNAQTCGQYVKARGRPGGARRDLEDLRAAINHHAREGLHRGLVRVALPAKGPGRDRWLSRSEAAALLWACWRYREVQTRHRGPLKNQKIETGKRPLRHIARFILIGLYTGTRAGAIASASPYRKTGRSSILKTASFIDSPRDGVRPKSGNRQRQFLTDCSPICAAGSGRAPSTRTLSSSTARQLNPSSRGSEAPLDSPSYPRKLAR